MNLFTYGTLCIPEVMKKVTGRMFDSETAELPGYESFLIRGRVYPGMIHTGRSSARGRVYNDLDKAAMSRIDTFEGDYYRRLTVRPVLENGSSVEADTFILIESLHYLLSDRQWDEKEFRRKYLKHYLGK